jgi:hypothetical protein
VLMSVIFRGGSPRCDSGFGWAAWAKALLGEETRWEQPAAAPADSQHKTSRRSMFDLL